MLGQAMVLDPIWDNCTQRYEASGVVVSTSVAISAEDILDAHTRANVLPRITKADIEAKERRTRHAQIRKDWGQLAGLVLWFAG